MRTKANLDLARKNKNDEYYTYYEDVVKGLEPYKEYLKGKRVLCPCDTEQSNFVKYLTELGCDVVTYHKTKDIPNYYSGVIAVPISYICKHNNEDFKIVGMAKHGKDNKYDLCRPFVNGKEKYTRLLIQRR